MRLWRSGRGISDGNMHDLALEAEAEGAQVFLGVENLADGDACLALEVPGRCWESYDVGQVGVDLVLTVEEDELGEELVLGLPKRALHLYRS